MVRFGLPVVNAGLIRGAMLDSTVYVGQNKMVMTTLIPSEFRLFVTDALASGRFRSEEELITTALRLLQDRERKHSALREDIQVGLDGLDRGDLFELGDAAARQAFFDDIKARGRQRLSARVSVDQNAGEQ